MNRLVVLKPITPADSNSDEEVNFLLVLLHIGSETTHGSVMHDPWLVWKHYGRGTSSMTAGSHVSLAQLLSSVFSALSEHTFQNSRSPTPVIR